MSRWDIFQWLVRLFFYIFWYNLINIPICPIYYTYIYSNIHNISEKELKSPENPIFKTQFKTQIKTQTQF